MLDPSIFYAYHSTYGYTCIYLYLVADYGDYSCIFASGSDYCEFMWQEITNHAVYSFRGRVGQYRPLKTGKV